MSSIEARLFRLEREARWWRRTAVGLGGICGALVFAGAAAPIRIPAELRARAFILEDARGEERAKLHVTNDSVGLSMSGAGKGGGLVILGASPKGGPYLI